MIYNGSAVATIILGPDGLISGLPMVSLHGIEEADTEGDVADEVVEAVITAVERLPQRDRDDDDTVCEAARRAVRRSLRELCGKRPQTEIHLVRV
jgi:ribonuclease J